MTGSIAIVITGISGAIGPTIYRYIDRVVGNAAGIYPTFRNPASFDRFVKNCKSYKINDQIKYDPLFVDITDFDNCLDALGRVTPADRCLIIHMAADVSWTRPLEVIEKTNVDGAVNLARAAKAVFPDVEFILFSTAFADGSFEFARNSYEQSKLDCVAALRPVLGPDKLYVVSPSGVLGERDTGRINQFNSMYPLMWLAARELIPVLEPAAAFYKVDCVPVDWVAGEVASLVDDIVDGRGTAPSDVVLSLGVERRISAFSFYEIVIDTINDRLAGQLASPIRHVRVAEPGESLPPVHVAFAGYSGQVRQIDIREPKNCRTLAPDLFSYLPNVVDYWLSRTGDSIVRAYKRATLS